MAKNKKKKKQGKKIYFKKEKKITVALVDEYDKKRRATGIGYVLQRDYRYCNGKVRKN